MKLKDILKRADELADDSWMSSPAVQAGLLGGIGYLGTQFLYDKVTNNPLQKQYLESIKDPRLRWVESQRLKKEQKRKKDNWSAGIGAAMASLPLINASSDIARGWDAGGRLWGGDTKVARGVSKASGALSSVLGGREVTDSLSTAATNHPRSVNDMMMPAIPKEGCEKSYIYDNLNKKAYSSSDAFSGRDFTMPYIRPLSTNAFADIPVASSMAAVTTPNNAAIMGHDNAAHIAQSLNNASGGLGAGMISTEDLTKTLSRGVFGYAAGHVLGSVLGTIFAQPPAVKEKLVTYGGLGGAVLNSGIFR